MNRWSIRWVCYIPFILAYASAVQQSKAASQVFTYISRRIQKDSIQEVKYMIEGLMFGRTREVVRRQGACDHTSDREEINQSHKSHLTIETKADSPTSNKSDDGWINLTTQRVLPMSITSSSFYHTAISNAKGALTLTKPGIQHFFSGRCS